ncbi:cardiolipin synthase [Ligilactobacillus sp. LYQ135]
METFGIIVGIIWFINLFAAIVTVFHEKRDISTTWAWLLVLVFIPVFGFILYLFVGRKISHDKIFTIQKEQEKVINSLTKRQKEMWQKRDLDKGSTQQERELEHLFLESEGAFLTTNNQTKLFDDGRAFFDSLLADIKDAQESIHVEFYTFYADDIGHEVLHALEDAAARGVEVRVLYDMWGSKGTNYKFFKKLEKLGGEAQGFISSSSKQVITTPRLNYHDHRKLVIIDGKIGYIGGFNIGDQYLGRLEKYGYWRDTHMRVYGMAVIQMQARFMMDWNTTCRRTTTPRFEFEKKYFPVFEGNGHTKMQIVSSGPDSERQPIKRGYQKIISTAQHYLYIQTPYLIPDDSVIESLVIAALSGVDVRIMIPCKPDHPFVYRATEYYAKYLVNNGVKVYRYDNGFLHAKTMITDDTISSVGSANLDFRSFKLNFECNAFCYDSNLTKQLKAIYEKDLEKCTLLTPEYFEQQSRWRKFKQYFSRLLSPTL